MKARITRTGRIEEIEIKPKERLIVEVNGCKVMLSETSEGMHLEIQEGEINKTEDFHIRAKNEGM